MSINLLRLTTARQHSSTAADGRQQQRGFAACCPVSCVMSYRAKHSCLLRCAVPCRVLQVKLTAEPKKQALELLRRKIEAQDTKVQAVRRRYQAAKQVRYARTL